jgi:UDP-N-acetylmuramate--alanine ligase
MVVVTNIDVDINLNIEVFKNLNYNYKRVLTKVKEIFNTFIERLPGDGIAVLCHDDPNVRSLLPELRRSYLTYGIDTEAHLKASHIKYCGFTSSFIVELKGKVLGEVHLKVPGKHNILNALAAIGVSLSLGLDFEAVAKAIGKFEGVSRRFNILGEVSGIMVVDDYAHNPAKIKATLSAVRTGERKRTIAIFQPHRYTRTKFLMDDYLKSFKDADVLIVTPIYSAGESVIEGITSEILVSRLKSSLTGKTIHYFAQEKDIMDYVLGMAQPGDLFLTMGAGDINLFASQLMKQLKQACAPREALACTT